MYKKVICQKAYQLKFWMVFLYPIPNWHWVFRSDLWIVLVVYFMLAIFIQCFQISEPPGCIKQEPYETIPNFPDTTRGLEERQEWVCLGIGTWSWWRRATLKRHARAERGSPGRVRHGGKVAVPSSPRLVQRGPVLARSTRQHCCAHRHARKACLPTETVWIVCSWGSEVPKTIIAP